eukprot:Seg513.1 transcript_id=Seg513.1/GoldUCD/mRNA.D3Y31 product="hypothetical protein" protein_id=Seg513.1/GoldUCD/D3Y31
MDAEGRFEKPIENLPSVEIRSPGERIDTARPQEDRQRATSKEQHQLRSIPEGSISQDQEQGVETRQLIHEEVHAVESDFLTYIDNRDYEQKLDYEDYSLVRNKFFSLRRLSVFLIYQNRKTMFSSFA